jgi:hypothetical protein
MFASPPSRRRRAARRARLIRRRLGGLAAVLALLVSAPLLWPSDSSGARPERLHVVHAGETVWSIASAAYGGDPRPHVDVIERRNGLVDSTVIPGQRLVLP